MTALLTLLVIAAFVHLVHRFAPRHPRAFHLEQFHAPGSLSDSSRTYYEKRRQYADLAAIYGRGDMPDPDAPARVQPERAGQRRIANPSCGAVEPTTG